MEMFLQVSLMNKLFKWMKTKEKFLSVGDNEQTSDYKTSYLLLFNRFWVVIKIEFVYFVLFIFNSCTNHYYYSLVVLHSFQSMGI